MITLSSCRSLQYMLALQNICKMYHLITSLGQTAANQELEEKLVKWLETAAPDLSIDPKWTNRHLLDLVQGYKKKVEYKLESLLVSNFVPCINLLMWAEMHT